MQQVFSLGFKKLESFGFYVGDVISGVGLGIFGLGYWAPMPRASFLTQVFIRNYVII